MKYKLISSFIIPFAFFVLFGGLLFTFGYKTGKIFNETKIYTADIKKLTENKRSELVKKLQQDRNNPDAITTLEKEYSEYLKSVDKVLDAYKKADDKALILRKEAVIDGNYTDITDDIKRLISAKEGKTADGQK